jgi:hypothetical protein
MGKKQKFVEMAAPSDGEKADLDAQVDNTPDAPDAPDAPAAPKQETDHVLVLGPKAPKHRVGHTGAAWVAILPLLPAKASVLAKLPELCVPQCGGPKGNGMLYVSYAMRRGWLSKQAQ